MSPSSRASRTRARICTKTTLISRTQTGRSQIKDSIELEAYKIKYIFTNRGNNILAAIN